ncbi:hypothetical protein KC19_VG129300 [Ceratodon purpureus]|uniref:Uncharacterized protein n=1 Tax=Ceratodon purpureus TaxID=3225 RepID=A0A8T0HPN5_CERPU|nr:hypothetical protein KC19_VG129300 [Ceratodon purpureus]
MRSQTFSLKMRMMEVNAAKEPSCPPFSLPLPPLSLSNKTPQAEHEKNGKGRFSRSAPHCHHRHLRTIIIIVDVRLVTWSNCPHRPTSINNRRHSLYCAD